jgi:hypothetical protein
MQVLYNTATDVISLHGMHLIVLSYINFVWFPSLQNNYQNLVHFLLCTISILALTV